MVGNVPFGDGFLVSNETVNHVERFNKDRIAMPNRCRSFRRIVEILVIDTIV